MERTIALAHTSRHFGVESYGRSLKNEHPWRWAKGAASLIACAAVSNLERRGISGEIGDPQKTIPLTVLPLFAQWSAALVRHDKSIGAPILRARFALAPSVSLLALLSSVSAIQVAQDTNSKNPPSDQHEIAKDAAVVLSTETKEQLCASGDEFNPEREEISAPMPERSHVFHQPIVASSCARKRRALPGDCAGWVNGANVRDVLERGKDGDPAET